MTLDPAALHVATNCDTDSLSEIEKLSQDLGDAYEQLTLIYRTVRHLGASFRLETIASQLLEHALEAAPARSAALFLPATAEGAVRFAVAASEGDTLHLSSAAIERFGALKRPTFWSGDAARALLIDPSVPEPSSDVLAAPLDAAGHALGFLVLARSGGDRFTTVESKLIGALCNVTAVAVANWQHYRAIQNEREMLDGVIREIGDGIVIAGGDWKARHTNPAARRYLQVNDESYDVREALAAFRLDRDVTDLDAAERPDAEFRAESRDARRPLVLACRAFRASFGASAEPIHVLRLRDATREHHAAEAQRDFMSLASHKLRTPLTKILGLLPLVAVDETSKELRAEGVCGIEEGASELSRLVNGILEFVDFRRGGHEVAFVDLRETAQQAIECATKNRPQSAPVQMIVDAELPPIQGSRHLLRTLVMNLVDNALKFSPHASAIEVRLERLEDDAIRVSVRDFGDGIAPELAARLFTPFSQQDLGFTGQDEGAGLGLLLAREAAIRHGGEITVQSELGKGACFIARLPLRGYLGGST